MGAYKRVKKRSLIHRVVDVLEREEEKCLCPSAELVSGPFEGHYHDWFLREAQWACGEQWSGTSHPSPLLGDPWEPAVMDRTECLLNRLMLCAFLLERLDG